MKPGGSVLGLGCRLSSIISGGLVLLLFPALVLSTFSDLSAFTSLGGSLGAALTRGTF